MQLNSSLGFYKSCDKFLAFLHMLLYLTMFIVSLQHQNKKTSDSGNEKYDDSNIRHRGLFLYVMHRRKNVMQTIIVYLCLYNNYNVQDRAY